MTTSPLTASEQSIALVNRFKQLYSHLDTTRAACAATSENELLLEQVYSDNIEFRDPLHTIRGLSSLRTYMNGMYGNVISCEFIFLNEWITDVGQDGKGSACIKWDMIFRHNKLAGGKQVTVRGISHIRFSDRVDYHEDVFDVGTMLYEHVPLMGRIVIWLKSRLGV